MKANHFFIILFSLFISFAASAQTKDEHAILEAMDKQVKAWNSGDIDVFMTTYWKNDSLLFVGSKGPIYGWQTTLESYKKSYPDTAAMGKLNFEILQIRSLSDDYSFVLGKWHLTRTAGNVGGYFTLLFRKIKRQWFIVADHTSK
ncbi:MAG TPA: nuclear transport factor 2 family protein [Chitinophagaceae bacterium]|nr:nuclear transport factor 2 family protein [Chitinophagaceae bacterium]